MMIIGCDFHSRFQQIAMLETETGEITERRLEHENGEARAFDGALPSPARVGMEATGYAGFSECWPSKGTNCGSEMRRRFARRWCGSRRRTRGTPGTFWTC